MKIQFFMPTNISIGTDAIVENADSLASLGKKALLVTGRHSAIKSGAQEDLIKVLSKQGIEYCIFNEIEANPSIESVLKGANFAATEKVDFVIGIGGGSPLDAAKAIAFFAGTNLSVADVLEKRFPRQCLPIVLIPTTAGTGSEVTPYSILTHVETKSKFTVSSALTFAKYALIDAKYTASLPKSITFNTAIDALSHAIESMLTIKHNAFSDLLCKESIRIIGAKFNALHQEKLSYEDREALLYASTLAGIAIAQTGTAAVHAMGYSLTNYKGIDHGRANALLIGDFLRLVASKNPTIVQEIIDAGDFGSIDAFLKSIDALLGTIEVISQDELVFYTDLAMEKANVKNTIVPLSKNELLSIFQNRFASN